MGTLGLACIYLGLPVRAGTLIATISMYDSFVLECYLAYDSMFAGVLAIMALPLIYEYQLHLLVSCYSFHF